MEWARHKNETFISSSRNDRQNNYDRNEARQDNPVNFDGYANAQNLIDAWRKRLCHCATKEARELAEDFKRELGKTCPEIAGVLVPNCIYRDGCPEFKACGYFEKFLHWCNSKHYILLDIQQRYDAYNKFFGEDK
ncbi:MAG: FAD-dependent thymidylate synthase [Treponema sp.]|nr:FAD-dependent thymidylate synthase [Treponema sp.]